MKINKKKIFSSKNKINKIIWIFINLLKIYVFVFQITKIIFLEFVIIFNFIFIYF